MLWVNVFMFLLFCFRPEQEVLNDQGAGSGDFRTPCDQKQRKRQTFLVSLPVPALSQGAQDARSPGYRSASPASLLTEINSVDATGDRDAERRQPWG